MKKVSGFLRLMRPANVVTSIADVLAGVSISGFFTVWLLEPIYIPWMLMLCVSTAALYAGGVVFNDVFDAELDSVERPERPIPSGVVSKAEAGSLGAVLLMTGILTAYVVNSTSAALAMAIAAFALIYDKWGKHHFFLGPVNMGLCRGLNLLLGMSVLYDAPEKWWFLGLVPVVYIAAITMISRGEVHGSKKMPLYAACIMYLLVIIFILWFSISKGMALFAIIFLLILAWRIYKPLFRAIAEPTGSNVGKSVKAGVIALIVMDSAWAAAAGSLVTAGFIICLLPVSMWLSEKFAVT